MKRVLQSLFVVLAFVFSIQTFAQRYVSEVFDTYQKFENVQFGVNVNPLIASFPATAEEETQWTTEMAFINNLIDESILVPDTLLSYPNFFFPNSSLPANLHTLLKITPLEMDVYTPPADDEVTQRPVFIYIHTGNFLPPLFNGAITGDKIDSAAVNVCTQMAKRGYVAVSINYRMGWNPTAEDENVRRGTLLQAVYRAVHDTQTAVRFLRSPAGNNFGIDASKISLIGQGSGGYVAQAYITLTDYSEIEDLPKFIDPITFEPYVIEERDGTIDGGPGFLRLHDPLFDFGLSKDVSLAANMGGALADESWLEAGEPAMVSFHCIRDPYAPFNEGMVVVPTTDENVVPVHGANFFIQKANDLGNNNAFSSFPAGDPYTDAARSHYGQTYDYIYATEPEVTVSSTPEGLFPFLLPLNGDGPLGVYGNQGAPWDFWDLNTLEIVVDAANELYGEDFNAAQLHAQGLLSNPGMGPEKGLAYIDTVQSYLHPRAALVMDLATGIGELPEVKNAMKLYPNPSSMDQVTIENDKAIMSEIIVMDALGREVFSASVNDFRYRLDHTGWNDGLYFVTVLFKEGGQLTKKLVIR